MMFKAMILLSGLFLCAALTLAATTQDSVDGPPPIFLTLFLHDQLSPLELASIGPDHMEWFLKELSEVSGRRVHVIKVARQPGITDFGYRLGDGVKALNELQQRVVTYTVANNLPLDTRRHKYVLVTRHNLTEDVLGISRPFNSVAIASLRSYATIAHEVGHLFDASHENAQTRFDLGLPCRTLMYASHSEFFKNCYVFSDANRQAIRDYLKGEPGR